MEKIKQIIQQQIVKMKERYKSKERLSQKLLLIMFALIAVIGIPSLLFFFFPIVFWGLIIASTVIVCILIHIKYRDDVFKEDVGHQQVAHRLMLEQQAFRRYDIMCSALLRALQNTAGKIALLKPMNMLDLHTHKKIIQTGNGLYVNCFRVNKSGNEVDTLTIKTVLQSTINSLLDEHKLEGISEPYFYYMTRPYPSIMIDDVYEIDSFHVAINIVETTGEYVRILEQRIQAEIVQKIDEDNINDKFF